MTAEANGNCNEISLRMKYCSKESVIGDTSMPTFGKPFWICNTWGIYLLSNFQV